MAADLDSLLARVDQLRDETDARPILLYTYDARDLWDTLNGLAAHARRLAGQPCPHTPGGSDLDELARAIFDSPAGHSYRIRMTVCRQLAELAVERMARLCPKCGSDQQPEEKP